MIKIVNEGRSGTPIATERIISPRTYVSGFVTQSVDILKNFITNINTTTDLRIFLNEIGLENIQDYGLADLYSVLGSKKEVCLVADPEDVRWFEIPDLTELDFRDRENVLRNYEGRDYIDITYERENLNKRKSQKRGK